MNNDDMPKVLIVDDDPFSIEILGNLLKNDYKIFIAKNGEQAINLALKCLPDLILLDIKIPGDMDGYMVCKELKENDNTKNIPIIFITVMSDEGDEFKGLKLGAIDYISKPFKLPIVKLRIKNHIELKKKTDLLELLSSKDGLTRIHNRRYFDELFINEWKRACREKYPLSLMLIDVDYFKDYNDNYGHAIGDECLKLIARTIKKNLLRPGDILARYGGDEFVVILANTSSKGAEHMSNKILKKIENLKIVHSHSQVANHITLSIGVATDIPNKKSLPNVLLTNADSMLSVAKKNGRNQVKKCNLMDKKKISPPNPIKEDCSP